MSVGGFSCVALERPWLDNRPNVSCIPEGAYTMLLGRYNAGDAGRGYPAYELLAVPGRSLIKIHAANKATEIQGCIALGEAVVAMAGQIAINSSRNTLNDFMASMAGDDAVIEITNG